MPGSPVANPFCQSGGRRLDVWCRRRSCSAVGETSAPCRSECCTPCSQPTSTLTSSSARRSARSTGRGSPGGAPRPTSTSLPPCGAVCAARTCSPPDCSAGCAASIGQTDHLVPSSGLRRLLERELTFGQLEDAFTPIHVVATDITSGRDHLLSEGDAIDAICASAAIPGVFPSVTIDGCHLVDGGVVNNCPISHTARARQPPYGCCRADTRVPSKPCRTGRRRTPCRRSAC